MTKYTEWRAWIGPLILPTSEATAYDWTWIEDGVAGQIGAITTTVGTTLSDGATSLVLTSGTGFPTAGSVFVGPNGSGQAWEVVRYSGKSTNTLTGCVREGSADREHNGVHTAGATVHFWYPITTDDGRLRLTEELDENLCAISWLAEISGVKAPQIALRNRHLCVIEYRQSPSATWTALCVGFLDGPQVRDDAGRAATWTVRVQSLAQFCNRFEAQGIRVGDLDIAKHVEGASSDVVLADVDAERGSGDFSAAAPDFEAASTADTDRDTLWIGERVLGTPNTPTASNGDTAPGIGYGLRFTGAYLNPRPGERSGTRWIEVTAAEDTDTRALSMHSADGSSSTTGLAWLFNWPPELKQGEKVLMVEDEAVFTALHPLAEYKMIREWADFFTHITPAGGHFALRRGELNQWWATFAWGNGHGYIDEAPNWVGPTVTAPGDGETMRYLWAAQGGSPDPADFWAVGQLQTAGYDIASSPAAWIRLDLPRLGLVLRDDVTAGSPGGGSALYISDGAGPSTAGLPSSGTVQIGSEQITYSARQKDHLVVTARGANGTTAAAHNEGDTVELIWSGDATQAHAVKRIGWRRYNGTNYPKWFRLKVAHLEGARNPTDAAYNNDWTELTSVNNHAAATWNYTLSPVRRVRSILLQIETMNTDPSRPRLNEIVADVDGSTFDAATTLAAGTQAALVIKQVLLNAGFPTGALFSATTPGLSGFTTAKEMAWAVIADLAQFAGVRVDVQRDSKMYVAPDPYWGASSWAAAETWTRITATAAEVMAGNNEPVSQVEIAWQTADNADSGIARYPAAAWSDGRVVRVGPMLFADGTAAAAAAAKMFFLRRYPYTLVVECADAEPGVRAGQVHALEWQLDTAMQETDRLYLVQSADHYIEAMAWTTVLTLIEIERSSQ